MRIATKQSRTRTRAVNEAGVLAGCEFAGCCFPAEPAVGQEDGGGVVW
jgi:hypothetical protein